MHHFRLVPLGSGPALSLAERALEEYGALRIGPREPSTWVWSVEDGPGALEVLSFTHEVPLGFEGLVDEIATGMVVDGETSVHRTRGVLPGTWHAVHDEAGRPLERDVLAWAGAVIAQRPRSPARARCSAGWRPRWRSARRLEMAARARHDSACRRSHCSGPRIPPSAGPVPGSSRRDHGGDGAARRHQPDAALRLRCA